MREVIVSEHLWGKIKEVNDYLINELHLSEEATEKRIPGNGMHVRIFSCCLRPRLLL